jgi:mono/diheme cytochrome c family protein
VLRTTAPARVLAALIVVGGCTYESAPDLLGEPQRELEVVSSYPAAGAVEVATNTWIDAILSAAPAGESISDGADFRLFSGLIESSGRVKLDLLERRLRFVPEEPLRPRLRYQMYLWGGVRGTNGARLRKSVVFDFTVGTVPGPELPPAAAADGAAVQRLFGARCASCHDGPQGRAGLDLTSAEAGARSLRDVRSDQHPALRRLQPGDHARSYLMRKLTGEGIFGARMPSLGAALTREELRLVADWIDGGAR